MLRATRPLLPVLPLICALAPAGAQIPQGMLLSPHERVAVTWDDPQTGTGHATLFEAREPWDEVATPLVVGADPFVRSARGQLAVVSRSARILTLVDPRTSAVLSSLPLPTGGRIEDVALTGGVRVYLSLADATHLVRLDLVTGQIEKVLDFRPFADADGIPDLGTMALDGQHLFVQVRRTPSTWPGPMGPEPLLAVVDLSSERFVDVDSVTPGVQAIALAGTPPKLKMQVFSHARRLFVGSTWAFFDEGGIESIDLDALGSLGLVLHEADGQTGADVGAFVMLDPARGYLTFSTDFALSSHLVRFSVPGGVETGELHVSLGYRAPALVHARAAGRLFVPQGAFPQDGLHVFDSETGRQLTSDPLPTGGAPTDLELVELLPLPAVRALWNP